MEMINNGWGYHSTNNKSSILVNRSKLLATTNSEIELVSSKKVIVRLSNISRAFTRKRVSDQFLDTRSGLNIAEWLEKHSKELLDAYKRSIIYKLIN